MDAERLKAYLLDFQTRDFSHVRTREVALPDSKRIIAIVGARRVGKTHLLYGKIRQLLEAGIDRAQILYLNFENPALADASYQDFKDILAAHWTLFPKTAGKTLYLFIDEPQAVERWELALRGLHDEYGFPLFVTGSSSKLLGREIATSLRGRSRAIELLPLSFAEFLDFKGTRTDAERAGTRARGTTQAAFLEYLEYGGYPEVVLETNADEKLSLLKDYLDLTVYKDIVERYNIKNTVLIRWLIDALASSNAAQTSLNKLHNDLKSLGMKVSKNTLYEYYAALQDSLFLHALRPYATSPRKQGLATPKTYLNDTGFQKLYAQEDLGRRLENAVYLQLRRLQGRDPRMSIHYWRDPNGREVDFLITHGGRPTQAIQVTWALDAANTQRELSSLAACANHLGLAPHQTLVLTALQKTTPTWGGIRYRAIPAWEWALTNLKEPANPPSVR